MEFHFPADTEQWRAQLRAFLKAELPPGFEGDDDFFDNEEQMAFAREFTKKLGAKRWFAPAWPERYGGMGKTQLEQMILNEELAYHRAPSGGRLFTIGITGPTMLVHGNDEQKQRYLPEMASGETWYCQGFSEPGSGSEPRGRRSALPKPKPRNTSARLAGRNVHRRGSRIGNRGHA